jgi:NitT/TauT family transport system ATP-binding protein
VSSGATPKAGAGQTAAGQAPSSSRPDATLKLTANGVGIRYPLRRERKWFFAVDDATFSVPRGGLLSIIGPSGCGKSTLLRAVAGLQDLYKGELLLDGQPVAEQDRADGADGGVGRSMVFQHAQLLPWRNVLRNVTLGLEVRGTRLKDARERAEEVIALVGLEGFEGTYPNALSGGMQQRVNLARALVLRPELLLLDEPFSALDAQTRELMGNELQFILAADNRTALFVTHDIDEAVFLADQVLVLSRGPRSHTKRILNVDLPRPRTAETRRDPLFLQHVTELRKEIFTVSQ